MALPSPLVGWLPWVAGAVAVGVAGATLGVAGAFGRPTEHVTVVSSGGVLPESALALACPGGAGLDTLHAGTRVLAIARSDDSSFLGVRDPDNYSRTLWVAAESVTIDPGQTDATSLPTGTCPEVTITLESEAEPSAPPPAPTPTDPAPNQPAPNQPAPNQPAPNQPAPNQPAPNQPAPPPPPPPPPPSDTTAPTIQQKSATPSTIYCPSNVGPGFPGNTVIRLIAADNVGVTSVSISWSGYNSGSGSMNLVGGEWQFPYTETFQTAVGSAPLSFTLTPRDAAGNTASTTVQVMVSCLV